VKVLSILCIIGVIIYLGIIDYLNHKANLKWLKDTTEKMKGE
jgi:hypothetical protein